MIQRLPASSSRGSSAECHAAAVWEHRFRRLRRDPHPTLILRRLMMTSDNRARHRASAPCPRVGPFSPTEASHRSVASVKYFTRTFLYSWVE